MGALAAVAHRAGIGRAAREARAGDAAAGWRDRQCGERIDLSADQRDGSSSCRETAGPMGFLVGENSGDHRGQQRWAALSLIAVGWVVLMYFSGQLNVGGLGRWRGGIAGRADSSAEMDRAGGGVADDGGGGGDQRADRICRIGLSACRPDCWSGRISGGCCRCPRRSGRFC